MFNVKDLFALLRIKQYYKNTIIFIPVIFSLSFLNINSILLVFLGFVSFCLLSSSIYILNDLKDIEKDKYHPEKKNRPLPSGKISKTLAKLIFIIILIDSLVLAYFLSVKFFYTAILLFVFSQSYTFYFRNIAFFDVILISINFFIRAIAGIFILGIEMSYWIVLCAFFLSMVLVGGKRLVEIDIPGIKKYRKCYDPMKRETLKLMMTLSISSVIIFFSVYSVFKRPLLLISLPISIYILLLYNYHIYVFPEKIRQPEKFFLDKKISFLIIVWVGLIIFGLILSKLGLSL